MEQLAALRSKASEALNKLMLCVRPANLHDPFPAAEALGYKLKRQSLPPRDVAVPLRMTSDCTGYGSVMQAVAHLGLRIHCVQCSEVDTQKRIVTEAVRKYLCCESGKMYYDLRDRVGDLKSQLPGPGVVDLHEGGYPCQSFSRQGLQLGGDDERGQLLLHGVEGILLNQPRLIFLENVADLALNAKHKDFFQGVLSCLRQGGYVVSYQVISALDHGLAQKRERLYIIGCRTDQSLCPVCNMMGMVWNEVSPCALSWAAQAQSRIGRSLQA